MNYEETKTRPVRTIKVPYTVCDTCESCPYFEVVHCTTTTNHACMNGILLNADARPAEPKEVK